MIFSLVLKSRRPPIFTIRRQRNIFINFALLLWDSGKSFASILSNSFNAAQFLTH